MARLQIALVGDYNPTVLAHQAIDRCFALANEAGIEVEAVWTGTETLRRRDGVPLKESQGIWCVPGSPYRSLDGALWAIELARTRAVPFLGTCGGYQHALLEYARNVLGLVEADHVETNPHAALPLLNRMQCSLVEKSQKVIATSPSFRELYGAEARLEGYHCNYGLNPRFEEVFRGSALEIVARSEAGEARAVMLHGHPFFVGAHFQPERAALSGSIHPLVQRFFTACVQQSGGGIPTARC